MGMDLAPPLPAADLLGCGIDLSTATPFDITSLKHGILTEQRVISLDSKTRTITIGQESGNSYTVPNNVLVDQSDWGVTGQYQTFTNGSDAVQALASQSDLQDHLLGLGGGALDANTLARSLTSDKAYGFYTYEQQVYDASLKNWADWVDESALEKEATKLPIPFNEKDSEIVSAYKAFFGTIGSHILTSSRYGARYQVCAWSKNNNKELQDNFSRNLTASFQGIPNKGDFDSSVFSESQYTKFVENEQNTISIQGGDSNIAQSLTLTNDYDSYTSWVQSAVDDPSNSDVISIYAQTIWSIMADADSKTLRDRANPIATAYKWILENPTMRRTTLELNLRGEWAEFGLLTPSARIIVKEVGDQEKSLAMDRFGVAVLRTETRLAVALLGTQEQSQNQNTRSQSQNQAGEDPSDIQLALSVTFYVENDGSPIDLFLTGPSNDTTKLRVGDNQTTYTLDAKAPSFTEKQIHYFYGVSVDGSSTTEIKASRK